MAKSGGSIISYDPNLRLNLWPDPKEAKERITQAVPLADIIKLNDDELWFITGKNNMEDIQNAIDDLLSMGPKLCVVTRGEEGCFCGTKRSFCYLPAFKVNSVDTTGCGDSFVAGLLVGILKDGSLKEGSYLFRDRRKIFRILRFASAAAAITSVRRGVIPALPTRAEIEEFISKL